MRPLLLLAALTFVFVPESSACISRQFPDNTGSVISVVIQGTGVSSTNVQSAVAMWNQCPQAGSGFPNIAFNGFGTHTITILYGGMNSGDDHCALQQHSLSSDGRNLGSTV